MENTITVLAWIVFATLILAIARQLSEQRGNYYMFIKEGFEDTGSEDSDKVHGKMSPASTSPGPIDLENPRESFNLLNDVLKPIENKNLYTAKSCYSNDFIAQSAKTGNYIQRTNNFRHAAPDNCSAPLTELVGSFYKNP
jgi:hypothetical protein